MVFKEDEAWIRWFLFQHTFLQETFLYFDIQNSSYQQVGVGSNKGVVLKHTTKQ